jgi:hypothetical protein
MPSSRGGNLGDEVTPGYVPAPPDRRVGRDRVKRKLRRLAVRGVAVWKMANWRQHSCCVRSTSRNRSR